MSKQMTLEQRWADVRALQKHYRKFEDFLWDIMRDVLGFNCSDIQIDIGRYLDGPDKRKMIQAQRGQAKTTISAIKAVHKLIMDPAHRVLIISAGDTQANEISSLIIQIIMGYDPLECLRPDTSRGDRSSVSAFDVNRDLKGIDKSPSVACVGVFSNLQGKRADTLIADDVESTKNSLSAEQRAKLMHVTKDFTSICSKGDIWYLGTPQTIDSVYNSLPGRGYSLRIWPGRYPTEEEITNYGNYLAPLLSARIKADPSLQTGGGMLGDRGQAIDPLLLPEDVLIEKELDQGAAYFQLQHMLDTKLADSERYPLKLERVIFADLNIQRAPLTWSWLPSKEYLLLPPSGSQSYGSMFKAYGHSPEMAEYQKIHMYVDPAGGGQNGDETAWAITAFLNGTIYLLDIGGMAGGLDEEKFKVLNERVFKFRPNIIHVEENFGKGAFRNVWTPSLHATLKDMGHTAGIEDIWESGQKELRIIELLEPILGRQQLVIDAGLIQRDWDQCQKYPVATRPTYSFFLQFARITRDKASLIHDDRVDALAGSCRFWRDWLAVDREKNLAKVRQDTYNKLISDPLGNGRPVPGFHPHRSPNAFDKYRRKV